MVEQGGIEPPSEKRWKKRMNKFRVALVCFGRPTRAILAYLDPVGYALNGLRVKDRTRQLLRFRQQRVKRRALQKQFSLFRQVIWHLKFCIDYFTRYDTYSTCLFFQGLPVESILSQIRIISYFRLNVKVMIVIIIIPKLTHCAKSKTAKIGL